MIYSKEFYLKKFKKLKPKLEKQGFEDFAHLWYSDGLYTGSSENDTVFFDQPDPDEGELRYLSWEPCFKCWRKTSEGTAHLEGHLEDDGRESYWVLEINYYKNSSSKRKGRSPIVIRNIQEIMEEHIKDIPKLLKN